MDDLWMYEDSMKMYLAEVVRGSGIRPMKNTAELLREQSDCKQGNHADFMSTVASQKLSLQEGDDHGQKGMSLTSSFEENKLTFNLEEMSPKSDKFSEIVVMVKETFPIKEIWVKKRRIWLITGMVVVCDSSGTEVEVMLWGKQCKNLLFISAGCLLHLQNFSISEFQKRMVIKLLRNSKLSNIGHISSLTDQVSEICPRFYMECQKLREIYPKFCSKVAQRTDDQHKIQFLNLKPGNVTHIRAKIISLSRFGSDMYNNKPLRITVTVLDSLQPVFLYLHGSSKLWRKKLILLRTKIWEFLYVACCSSSGADNSVELHTTVISQARALFECDNDALKMTSAKHKIITSSEELHEFCSVQSSESLQLSGIIAKDVTCHIGKKQILLSDDSKTRLVNKIAEKCLRLREKVTVEITARCHFQKEPSQRPFLIVVPGGIEGLDLAGLISGLFSNSTMVLICEFEKTVQRPKVSEDALLLTLLNIR